MAGDDKVVKVVHEQVVKGDQQVLKSIKDTTKAYQDLEAAVKRTKQAFADLMAGERDLNRQLADNTKKIEQQKVALQNMQKVAVQSGQTTWTGGGNGGPPANVHFGRMTPFGGGGSIPPGGIGNFLRGQNPYNGGYGNVGRGPINWAGGMLKAGGMLAGAGQLIGRGTDMYSSWQEHKAHQEMKDKTQGLENLARSQAYRNYKYQEAMSSPIGYVGMKRGAAFNVRTADSSAMQVDAQGRIIGADAGPMRGESGLSFARRGSGVGGENRLLEAKQAHGVGHMVAGGAGMLGGAAMIGGAAWGGAKIGAGLGTMVAPGIGTAIGGVAGGLIGGAGAALMTSSFKEALGGYFEEKSAAKKKATGELSAQSSEGAVRAEQLVDDLLSIRRARLQAFDENSGSKVALQRQTIGGFGGAGFYGSGYGSAEIGAAYAGAQRFGARGRGLVGGILGAGNAGMSMGAATQIMGMGASSSDGGQGTLQKTIAAGFAQGWSQLDMAFFEKMGVAFAEGLQTSSMGKRGGGIDYLYSGLGPGADPQKIAARGRAEGLERDIFRGNAYFSSQAMLQASNILGGDANGVQIGALGKASISDLLSDNPEKLNALGITSQQRQEAVKQRIGSLGNVLGGDKGAGGVGSMIQGAGGFQNLLQNIATGIEGSKSGSKERAGFEEQLSRIAAVGSEVLGEEDFQGLQQLLAKMGFRTGATNKYVKGGGKTKFNGVVSGAARGVIGAKRELQQEEAKLGEGEAGARDTNEGAAAILEENDGGVPTEAVQNDINALKDAARTGKPTQKSMRAQGHAHQAQGGRAGQAGGYGSTEELLKTLGTDITTLDTQVKKLVGIMNNAEPVIRKLGGRP